MKVLITGVNGFIGQALFSYLSEQTDYSVFVTSRKFYQAGLRPDEIFFVSDISNSTNWMSILSGVDVVIHLAARAHVLEKDGVNSANQFNSTNVDGTLQLARHALQSGVSRFIFISSIGVNGAETINKAFSESDQPNPCAEYAMSKLRAEQELIRLLSNKKMDYVDCICIGFEDATKYYDGKEIQSWQYWEVKEPSFYDCFEEDHCFAGNHVRQGKRSRPDL